MYYRLMSVLFVTLIVMGCSKSGIIVKEYLPGQIIHYRQLDDKQTVFDHVIYLNKGDTVPVYITLDSELVDISNEKMHLILKQRIYFRLQLPEGMVPKNIATMSEHERQSLLQQSIFYISADAKSWAAYTDVEALEKLFGIKGGSFSVGMAISKDEGVKMLLNAKTNAM